MEKEKTISYVEVVAGYFLSEKFLSRIFWWILVAFLFLVAFGYMRYKWQQENDAPSYRYEMEQARMGGEKWKFFLIFGKAICDF